MSDVRYIATRLPGNGTEQILDPELPISSFTPTSRLSAPNTASATIAPHFEHLEADDGSLLLEKWSTAIYEVVDGEITFGGIYVDDNFEGDEWGLELISFTGYPSEMPYTDSWVRTDIDPLDVFREVWRHLQSKPGGDLGLVIDQRKSGKSIGRKIAQAEYDTQNGPIAFEYEPVRFSWYETHDLGDEVNKLVEGVPFDYRERHQLNADGTIGHFVDLGYPRLGRRRTDIRFTIGDNVEDPGVQPFEEEYASGVLGLGAGEGAAMKRAEVYRSGESRLRRIAVHEDKASRSASAIDSVAKTRLKALTGEDDISDITVLPDSVDELLAAQAGDEVRIVGRAGAWKDLDMWVKILGRTHNALEGTLSFEVRRADKV